MLLFKSDERERWDPRCAELEWFWEIRFNFQRQRLELCCCRRRGVCVGEATGSTRDVELPWVSVQSSAGLNLCACPKADPAGEKNQLLWGSGW